MKFEDLSKTQLKQVIKNYRLHLLEPFKKYSTMEKDQLINICKTLFDIDDKKIKPKNTEPIYFDFPEDKRKAKKEKAVIIEPIKPVQAKKYVVIPEDKEEKKPAQKQIKQVPIKNKIFKAIPEEQEEQEELKEKPVKRKGKINIIDNKVNAYFIYELKDVNQLNDIPLGVESLFIDTIKAKKHHQFINGNIPPTVIRIFYNRASINFKSEITSDEIEELFRLPFDCKLSEYTSSPTFNKMRVNEDDYIPINEISISHTYQGETIHDIQKPTIRKLKGKVYINFSKIETDKEKEDNFYWIMNR